MSGIKGNPESLRRFAKNLRELPKVVAQNVASKAAPSITGLARSAYTGGQTVYGARRPFGVNDNVLTLRKSGATLGALRFVAIGTRVRVQLGTRYAKYLIGRYGILPNGGLPFEWSKRLASDAAAAISEGVAQ